MRFIHAVALAFLIPIATSGQTPSPEEAVTVLRNYHSLLNMTDVIRGDGPTVMLIPSNPTSGPFGEFRPFVRTAPLSNVPYFYRTPLFSSHKTFASFPALGGNRAAPNASPARHARAPRRQTR